MCSSFTPQILGAASCRAPRPGTIIQASSAVPMTAPRAHQALDLVVGELPLIGNEGARASCGGAWRAPGRRKCRAPRRSTGRTGAFHVEDSWPTRSISRSSAGPGGKQARPRCRCAVSVGG